MVSKTLRTNLLIITAVILLMMSILRSTLWDFFTSKFGSVGVTIMYCLLYVGVGVAIIFVSRRLRERWIYLAILSMCALFILGYVVFDTFLGIQRSLSTQVVAETADAQVTLDCSSDAFSSGDPISCHLSPEFYAGVVEYTFTDVSNNQRNFSRPLYFSEFEFAPSETTSAVRFAVTGHLRDGGEFNGSTEFLALTVYSREEIWDRKLQFLQALGILLTIVLFTVPAALDGLREWLKE